MITIKPFKLSDSDQWNAIVSRANNGTIFHLREFLGYHPPNRFKDMSLLFLKKDSPFVVFPAAEKIMDDEKWLISHPGASMGSFVAPENLSIADSFLLIEALTQYSRDNNFNGIRITIPPVFYQKRPSNYLDFTLLKSGFTYIKREITSVLFLEDAMEKNLKKFKETHRRAVKKAIKMGVEVRQSDDYESFYKILEKNLKIRHDVMPTHTLEELKHLHNIFPEDIQLFAAYIENIMIAGVVNFIVNQRVVLAFYISHDEQYQDYRAVNLLFYKMFEWAIKKKLQCFDFGIFTVNEEPNMGLGRFKENFGASGIFRDTLELKLS
ncbi:MAG: peptidoglycan bridge formation glycyltransferase FemA/FemB family protein [Candidatus Marinimicrobia bacterium]|nr:peptidoglycan bridge formation glycyltransferase FemA/FemB family protein [Candidatus Neomarinimicrobiota bacterium]